MARSTFKVLFYVNGSKEKNGIVPIMGRVTINGTVAQFSCKQSIQKNLWNVKGKLGEWYKDSIQWLQQTFGKENVVAAHLHMDEKAPHIHATVIPIVTGERRKAKKEQNEGKRKYRKKSNTVRLCADDLPNRQKLIGYHDSYATVMTEYGLERGARGSEARHTTTTQYYREVRKMNNTLDMGTQRLQEQKAEAEEELKQVKSEIRTDKFKSVATDTATALASSVGSLFGSGKMKSLERKNKDLQDRILEFEKHAQQREQHIKAMEQQQAKHIEEIKDAYEERHRNMSDFADFIKCYFPYMEKLMPMINFLRERLRFKDSTIRKLCEFKNVTVSGSFYSSEFNQNFEAKHSVCSIKQEENGGYDFKIDCVSHVSWFRKKRDEWREAMGIPKQRQTQNRGMKL